MSRGSILFAALLGCLVRASLTVSDDVSNYPVPSIVDDEPFVTVLKGGTASLQCKTSCDCKSSISAKVSWLENGRNIVSNDYTHVTANGVLHVKNCSSGMHDRVFRCVAAVGNWSVVSVERRIQVIDPSTPSLSLQASNQVLPIGGTTVIRCSSLGKQIFNSSAQNHIYWYKDKKEISLSNGIKYSTLPGGHLIIQSLAVSDSGKYQCKYFFEPIKEYLFSNAAYVLVGSSENSQSMPEFSIVPHNTEARRGSPVSIFCSAKGNPTPHVTISRENHVTSSKVVAAGVGFANFTLQSVNAKDAGRYACYITSGDIKRNRDFWLDVVSPPKFVRVPPRRKLTLKGFQLSINCKASGFPEPVVTWYKDGRVLVVSETIQFNRVGELKLKSTQQEHAGIYQCIASNKVGSTSHSIFVFLERSVRPPINLKARPLSATSINVTWQPNPINNENAILAHVVFYVYNTSSSKPTEKEKVIGETSVTSCRIGHLFGGTWYSVYLLTYVKNKRIKSAKSEIVKVKTLESVPSISPHPIRAVNLGNKMIRVLWTPIPLQFANGRISQYKVDYGIAGLKMRTIFVPASKTQIDITKLRLGELYNIEVSAGTSAGFGDPAQTTIKIGDPEIADQNGPRMEYRSINSTSIEVNWILTRSNYITGFILTYIPIITADYWHSVKIINLDADQRSYVIGNLNPRKDYRIEIKIVSGPVQSKSSVIVHTARRRIALPSDLDSLKISNPRNLECAVKDNTSIYLSWTAPVHTDDIDHYTVQIELGGQTVETYKTYHTKELRYLLENLSRGTWYYVRVNAIPKASRINELANKLKRKFLVPKYQSKVVACMTTESRPGPPKNLRCNVTRNGHRAKALWYPPDYSYGLVVKYIIRYKHLVREPRKTEWKIASVTMKPNTNGYPLIYDLDVEYYRRYRIEVSAVNAAGEGPAAIVESCVLRSTKNEPTDKDENKNDDSTKSERLMSDDTQLGIIVGCSIASLFIFTFVVVFIWKNPFRLKSTESERTDSSKTNRHAIYSDEFLYLQRLAEMQNNTADCGTRCSSSGRRAGNNDVTGASQPLMQKYHTTVELTGSSSGQPICTCTCLLHGRLRGQMLNPRERREITAEITKASEDTVQASHRQSSASTSHNSEDIDSAESADSRTQILPKTLENAAHASKETSSAKVLQQIKKETTFQV